MADPKEPLILDLVAWLAAVPRPYPEVMDLWRTSCPRLTVWEDATERGLIACEARGDTLWVVATARGLAAIGQPAGSTATAEPRGSAAIAEPRGSAAVAEPRGSAAIAEPRGSAAMHQLRGKSAISETAPP